MANDQSVRGRDKLHEISMKLEQSHLVYLQADDSPLKLQQRHKLEGYIKEYLCLVPNDNKYIFQETADILHRSAATVQDFSGYRACTAWSAISLYAANLLAQPWRKEYRTLRIYSGYYKHEVEANLIGAELMFESMGYKHTGLGVLTLEGPIDPDKVSSVSRDAIVAFVECQILKQIWEGVTQNFTVSWLDVLEFRENHVGTPDQAIRALNYRFLEKMHQIRTKPDIYRDYRQLQTIDLNAVPPAVPYHVASCNYNAAPPTCQMEYRMLENSNISSGHYRYFHPVDHGIENKCNTYEYTSSLDSKYYGGIHNNPYCSKVPTYTTRVPTGRLIEIDTPIPVVNYEKSHSRRSLLKNADADEVNLYRRQTSNSDHCEYAKVEKKLAKPASTIERDTLDSWDFVYRNLESLGYSKDLGDREDVLHKKEQLDSRGSRQKLSKFPLNEYEDQQILHRFEKRKGTRSNVNEADKTTINSQTNRHEEKALSEKKKSSELPDSSTLLADSALDKQYIIHENNRKYSQTLPSRHGYCFSELAKVTDSCKNLRLSRKSNQHDEIMDRWSCSTCTFLNMPEKEICEMCGKSKYKGNEDKPLASGGKECPQCTLVNEKNVTICDACGASLKDSPTYI